MTTPEQTTSKPGIEPKVAVAAVVVGGVVTLYALNKGLRGIGDLRLTGSAAGAVEWLAYAAVVGGAVRVAQVQWPDHPAVQALGFVLG